MSRISDLICNAQSESRVKNPTAVAQVVRKAVEEARSLKSKQDMAEVENAAQLQIMKNVDHPSHYQTESGIEAIDVIEAFGLGFNLGNAVKYILRCGKKDNDVQELEKAKWYLERELMNRREQLKEQK